MTIQVHLSLLESILSDWSEALGDDYAGYRNHVYRVVNFCSAMRPCSEDEQEQIIIAACFHDLGIWSDGAVDYLPPSIAHAGVYLEGRQLSWWFRDIEPMIALHHKVTAAGTADSLAEMFRRADLIDVSLGMLTFGLPRVLVRRVRSQFPNSGFHRALMRLAARGLRRRPLRPLPMFKW